MLAGKGTADRGRDRMIVRKGKLDKGKGTKKLRKWVVGKCVEDRGRGRMVAGKRMVD
jgi:hypothetical protein